MHRLDTRLIGEKALKARGGFRVVHGCIARGSDLIPDAIELGGFRRANSQMQMLHGSNENPQSHAGADDNDEIGRTTDAAADIALADRSANWLQARRGTARFPEVPWINYLRVPVVLRYYEDMSEAEIAGILGISLGTVKSTVSRAVAKLRIDSELQPD